MWLWAAPLLVAQSVAPPTRDKGQLGDHRRVLVFTVNGAEWDIIRPLLVRGELPNLAKVVSQGTWGKLKTVSAPNCPKVYSTIATSAAPEVNGITGFLVGGVTANTDMLKREPIWSILSKNHVTVGMANVPATFPVMPVNGYMISGMLTKGKGCEDGVLCSPKLSEVQGGQRSAVFPEKLATEILQNLGDIHLDCVRMPAEKDIRGNEAEVVRNWLKQVSTIREEQNALFDYLLTNHPTDFTMMTQSCEDRVGHWLYPIQPHNVGYSAPLQAVSVSAFPDQYRAMDKVLGTVLSHLDQNTTLFILSDHGIKPIRDVEAHGAHSDHAGTTPVIAKHDYEDGDEVPGLFVAMGPGIAKNKQIMGLEISVYDIAPTILNIFGIERPLGMQGRLLQEIYSPGQEVPQPHHHGTD